MTMPRDTKARRMCRTKKLAALILVFSMSAAGYLGFRGISELSERKQGMDYYRSMAENEKQYTAEAPKQQKPQNAPVNPEVSVQTEEPMQQEEAYTSVLDFEAIQNRYPNCVGWIEIDGIGVDYPIMQGTDNSFYLYHLADGQPNECGAIMMDASCSGDFSDDATVIHGHHLQNGTMFGSLEQFGNRQFFEEHPVFRIYSPDGDYDVQIFAAYTADPARFGYPTNFGDETAQRDFLTMIRDHAANVSDVDIQYGDRLVILSTCAYSFENARFVVVGKLVRSAG